MRGRHEYQPELFSVLDYEKLIPKNHLLRRVEKVLDLSFLSGLTTKFYSTNQGRPSIDPEIFIRIVLLGYLYDIDSDRRLCEELGYNRGANPAFRSEKIRSTTSPNEIWSLDFKGQFRTRDGHLCYPLTLSDHFSRYLLLCEALEGTHSKPAEIALEEAFEACGLPQAVLSDNGCPFGSRGIFGLSRISLWLTRLEIDVLRIEPAIPNKMDVTKGCISL